MTSANLKYHPLANIFPLLEGQEFDDLAADVSAHGVIEPIWIYNDQIIDGRNRYRAAQQAGVDCPMREYLGNDPTAFVVSLNLKRRHLSESQRAMIAAKLANLREGRPSETASIEAVSQRTAADMLKVGRASVQRAKTVRDLGVPELQEA